MTQSSRKLVGTVLLLLFVIVYALLALAAAVVLQVNSGKFVELVFYAVAGLLWVLPAAWLIKWMSKPDADGKPN